MEKLFIFIFVLSISVFATDIITSKTGKKINCKVLNYQNGKFEIEIESGQIKKVSNNKIKSIEFNSDSVKKTVHENKKIEYEEVAGKFTPAEIIEKKYDFEGKVVKLEFNKRSNIEQIAKGLYSVNLYLGYKNIVVNFPEEAYSWFDLFPGSGTKHIYCIVGIADIKVIHTGAVNKGVLLKAIGRHRKVGMNSNVEYSW